MACNPVTISSALAPLSAHATAAMTIEARLPATVRVSRMRMSASGKESSFAVCAERTVPLISPEGWREMTLRASANWYV